MNWTNRFANRAAHMRRSSIRELLKLAAQPGMISFGGGLPAPELFPVEETREAAAAVLDRVGGRALQYSETEGAPELREYIAQKYSASGHRLTAANVAVTSGGQQALDLIGRVLLNAGDKVIVENPTYLALLSAWRPLGVEFLGAGGDADGICVEELAPLLQQKPKLLYTVLNFQNPQGTQLSLERRSQLVEMLRANDAAIIEDDPYGELRYDGGELPSLFELDARVASPGTSGNALHVGTFSKVLMPGLRVGWVAGPAEVIDKLVQAKQAADLHTNTLGQHIILELLRRGALERQIPKLRAAYRERRDAMLAAMDRHFPAEATWTRPSGGMFLMVTLPEGLDAEELLKAALELKVAFVPGRDMHVNGGGRNTLRLNFSNATPELIACGIERLGTVLKRACQRDALALKP